MNLYEHSTLITFVIVPLIYSASWMWREEHAVSISQHAVSISQHAVSISQHAVSISQHAVSISQQNLKFDFDIVNP